MQGLVSTHSRVESRDHIDFHRVQRHAAIMTPTFRQYLERIQRTDASARDILSWDVGVADASSWDEAVTALKRGRRLQEMMWAVRFLWHDYRRSLSRLDGG